MKRNNKSLMVPTIILGTLGWSWFSYQAIQECDEVDSDGNNYTIEDLKQLSLSEQVKESHQHIYDEYDRLKEEERKRLEELERQRIEKLEKERLAKLEAEKKQRELEEAKKKALSNKSGIVYNDNKGGWVNAELTHFIAFCKEGCTGTSASGIYLGNSEYYQGYRIVAVPPSIPLYSILEVVYPDGTSFQAIALDRGGAISHVGILDVLVSTESKARKLGRKNGKYRVIGKLNR